MPFRKLLIRIMLWSLGATAAASGLKIEQGHDLMECSLGGGKA